MRDPIDVRRATAADAPLLARHRAEMFRDMGDLPDDGHYATLQAAAQRDLAAWLTSGDYVSFVASPRDRPSEIVAGAGVQIRKLLPRPVPNGGIRLGPEAIVLNVFTERAWRRQGIAEQLMQHVIDWAKHNGIARLVLHASTDGRPLYERLGFEATNEMAFTGALPGTP